MWIRGKALAGSVLLLSLAGIALGGCAVKRPEPAPRLASIEMLDRALLVTEGIEIEVLDADGSMPERIRPDELFSPGRRIPTLPWVRDMEEDAKYSVGGYPYFYKPGAYYGIVDTERFDDAGPAFSDLWLVRRTVPGSPAARAGLGVGDGTFIWAYDLKGKVTGDESAWNLLMESQIDQPVGQRLSYMACRSLQGDCEPVRQSIEAEERARPYRVRVHVAGHDRPLHGLLAFFPVYSTAEGSAGRLYRMDIPDRYIEQAAGGNVAVIYQPYEARYRYRGATSGDIEIRKPERVSWALWMSDVPFYD